MGEGATLIREYVAEATSITGFLIGALFEKPATDKLSEPVGKHRAWDVEILTNVVVAHHLEKRLTQYQEAPSIADGFNRLSKRAIGAGRRCAAADSQIKAWV